MSLEERRQMNASLLAATKAREEKLSTHPTINRFLKEGYYLKFWDDRYSAGIRVALGRDYCQEFSDVCELTDSGDIEAAGISEYLLNAGSWLPFDCGLNVQDALDSLEAKLAVLPEEYISRSSDWADKYDSAFNKILESADGDYGIANAIDSGKLPSNPFVQQ